MSPDPARRRVFARIILAYPVALTAVAVLVNLVLFDPSPPVAALPASGILWALIGAAVLLVINHSWLMTSTELTRLAQGIRTTPEEWQASAHAKSAVAEIGWQELERRQNAHRNTTENLAVFTFAALAVSFASPDIGAAQLWILAFALARLGHGLGYLTGHDGLRGLSMSLGLIALYGLVSLPLLGLLV